jgi:hypothetical protein
LDECGRGTDKRRDLRRNESGEKERMSEKGNEGFKKGEVYNPRFMGRR